MLIFLIIIFLTYFNFDDVHIKFSIIISMGFWIDGDRVHC